MSSYFQSFATTAASRYKDIKRTLLSDETDGDTEDDSHVSRVLRNYYMEKGRPFPPWLPPDPRQAQQSQSNQYPASGRHSASNSGGRGGGRGGGLLSDLWDGPQEEPQPPAHAGPQSLRKGGGQMASRPGLRPGLSQGTASPYDRAPAPLPSQRAGSYQTSLRQSNYSPPPGSTTSNRSAQERLKARFMGGGRSASPSDSPQPSPALSATPQRPLYDRGDSGRSAASGGRPDYRDKSRSYNDRGVGYNDRNDQGNAYGGQMESSSGGSTYQGNGREQRPYAGSSAPWSTGEVEDGGGGRGYGDLGRRYGGRGPNGSRPR